MYLITIILPLFSSLVSGLFGRHLGFKGSSFLPVICILSTFISSLFIFYETSLIGCCTYIKLISWINCELLHVDWGFMFDSLTAIMCCLVTFVSFLVHLYSTEYMQHDPHLPRFISYLSLFTFFMLILISADNFVQMFVGWEGVGLCSYLLINFWFTRFQASKAAIKAMLLNRVGDFSLILGILNIFVYFKSLDYASVFLLTPFFKNNVINFLNFNFNLLTVIGICLFVGAVGKSAQLGLHTWLPDAMEGPTPVSALIHAATMVTAGVFLIARVSPILEYSNGVLEIVTIIGSSTTFFAATVGLVQNDLKKVIAYSTCSQLGYMVFACGLSNYSVGIFHLVNHAFFKALLFLSAGSVIHSLANEQDMRKMGGLKKLLPFSYSMTVIGSLALIGFPFLAGFYSKDLILEIAYGKYSVPGHYSYYLGSFSAFFTAFYSTRLIYLTFLSPPNGYKQVLTHAYESSYQISISLGVLAIPSIFIGFFLQDMLVGLGTDFWGNAVFVLPKNMNQIDSEFINKFYKLLPLKLSILGVFVSFDLYHSKNKLLYKTFITFWGKKIYNFLNKKWFFDKIYNEQLAQFFFEFGYTFSYKEIDKGVIEFMSIYSFSSTSLQLSNLFHKLETIRLSKNLFIIFFGFTLVFSVLTVCSKLFCFLIFSMIFFIYKDIQED